MQPHKGSVCVSFQEVLMPNLEIQFLYACAVHNIGNSSGDTVTDHLWIVRMLSEKLEFLQFGENSDGESHVLDKIECAAIAVG